MIAIIDYGLGNIQAFVNVYNRLGIPTAVAKTTYELETANKLILPGVGAFDHAMVLLDASGMRQALDHLVLSKKVPILGICVGMQIFAKSSEEGKLDGLGWIPGRVRAFKSVPGATDLPLPHMGWNDVHVTGEHKLFKGLEEETRFYFLHSYFFESLHQDSVIAAASYGIDFCCAVQSGNVYGVQFHPEKSHHFGTDLLKNFAEL
ncbi:imidazole glycerol phosphate synthase subunit HisH [Geotalea uraniireducens]|uniref:Imidazole glycerol phosphate synthase subunit HisH n=1 Tax=Geotalea uraniireducens (strain Rf4) TaxID=351605 RepID=A5GEN1_GEOUR|nr:imidazole glycerol phosphate synthase subunit HisH [Geotalea uraniireducens]ABQ25886.1 imidazole glycerol phosphate synthase subunit hisH [Geotalea uraniireducens Rf4]